MAISSNLRQREYDKFVADGSGNTAIRAAISGGTITADLIIDGDLTVLKNFYFGDAGIDTMTIAGYLEGSATGKKFVSIGNATSALTDTDDFVVAGKTELQDTLSVSGVITGKATTADGSTNALYLTDSASAEILKIDSDGRITQTGAFSAANNPTFEFGAYNRYAGTIYYGQTRRGLTLDTQHVGTGITTVSEVLRFSSTKSGSGTGANGVGYKMTFSGVNAAGTSREYANLNTIMSTATDGAEVGAFGFYLMSGGVLGERFRMQDGVFSALSSGTATVGNTSYASNNIMLNSSVWDTNDAVARSLNFRIFSQGTSATVPYGNLFFQLDDDTGGVTYSTVFKWEGLRNTINLSGIGGAIYGGGLSLTELGVGDRMFMYADWSADQWVHLVSAQAGDQFVLGTTAAIGQDFDHADLTDPVLYIHDRTAPNTTNNRWIGIRHDNTSGDAYITTGAATGAGTSPATISNSIVFAPQGTESFKVGASGALDLIGGAGGRADFTMKETTASTGVISHNFGYDQWVFAPNSTRLGNQIIIGQFDYYTRDFDHAATTNPTLFIHSAENPDTDNTQWLGLSHDQTNAVIGVGKGLLDVSSTGFKVKITTVADATYNLLVTDYILHVTRTATGACAITLPTAQTVSGRTIVIKDTGNANTNNITIATEGAQTIDGGASALLDTDYGTMTLYSDGTNWFTI